MTNAYIAGFCKAAEVYGVDPEALLKSAAFYYPDRFKENPSRPKAPVPFSTQLANSLRLQFQPDYNKPKPLPKSNSIQATLKHDMRQAGPGGINVQVK